MSVNKSNFIRSVIFLSKQPELWAVESPNALHIFLLLKRHGYYGPKTQPDAAVPVVEDMVMLLRALRSNGVLAL